MKKPHNDSWFFSVSCTHEQLIDIWEELKDAYHNSANYGGDVAEIYAYRLMTHKPCLMHSQDSTETMTEYKRAGYNLLQICRHFTMKHNIYHGYDSDVVIEIKWSNDEWIDIWNVDELLLSHRCHIRVRS